MVSKNIFFKNNGPISLKKIIDICKFKDFSLKKNNEIKDISNLNDAGPNEITFFHSQKYKYLAEKTNAGACITLHKFKKYLPLNCSSILVDNVLHSFAIVAKKFYPDADIDHLDSSLVSPDKSLQIFDNVKFGKNCYLGKNVLIGRNTVIGNNSIVEHDVKIGSNCLIGSNVVIKNTIIHDNVFIQDGCLIGIKGFGFVPILNKNFRLPHIGKVILNNGVEIGSGSTVDRGSISDTIIGENTFLDNQVHVAHNVKIGKNCMIAGQVGIAGSAILGNNVVIGGQAGISGHLKIGDNVKIGGGSGVIKDVPDNSKIMGYPAMRFRNFIKKIEV